ncbi:Hydin [Symbiodinium sp. CCMP2456]|nr:Hydin [Symbiodinium sp. CCMP2456]
MRLRLVQVRFFIKVQPPFYVNIDTCYLRSGETLEIRVEFDPAYKVDRVCGTVKQKLTIVYQDHPQRDHVNLVGEVIFPNLTLSNNKLDFGSVLNETSKQLTITMANPNALPVNFQWSFVEEAEMSEDDVSGGQRASVVMQSTANSAANSFSSGAAALLKPAGATLLRNLEMSSLPRLSQVAEMQGTLLPKQKQRPAVDINQIFDILPIMGVLEPGHSQDVTFTYFGMKNQKFDCLAVCQTEGGPEYEVTLKGQASRLDFRLDKTELDFGEIPYTEVQEREIVLANTGKVAFQFNWNLCALSRPPVLDCWPVSGQINPGDKERITIRFRTGIPDEVNEVALLEVAHFERQRINVRGHGIFPGILLLQGSNPDVFKGLERGNEQEHQTNKELALQRLRENGPPPQAACVSSTSSMHSAEISANESAASLAEWQPEPQVVEFEVDRHFICQSLLAKEKELWEKHLEKCNKDSKETFGKGSARGSARGRGERRPMLEVTHITAAYYECNFGHIVLGHSGKKVISVYNCFHENVSFNINKRLLMQKGFQISPEKVSKLPPGKQVKLELTCFRDRTGEEGKQELNWIIPVRGGPSYEVKLMSEFVRPDLELSSDSIDFGHVVVGQVKRITIKLRNAKSVMASWDYKAPTAKPGKPMEFAYSLSPRSGRVAPGESQLVTVSFTPTSSRSYNQKVALRIMDNPMRKMLHMRGCGDGLRVNVEPSTTFELGPVLPGTEDCMQELFLCNPTNYTIEVYSVDFDTKYQEEEFFLHVYDKYENNSMEMPVRTPGAPTWPAVAKHGREVRRQQERQRRLQEKERRLKERALRREEASLRAEAARKASEEPPEDPEEAEKVTAELAEAEAALAEVEAEPEEQDEEEVPEEDPGEEGGEVEEAQQPEMDPADFPYRVLDEDRLHVLLLGPPLTGKSSLAAHLEHGKRKILSVDAAVDWALSGPATLQGPQEEERRERLRKLMAAQEEEHEKAEKEREAQAKKSKEAFTPQPARYSLPIEDVTFFLQHRMQLPDCNACVVFDGADSNYLTSAEQTVTALLGALWPEQLMVLSLSPTTCQKFSLGEGLMKASPENPDEDAEQLKIEVAALQAQYASLKAATESRVQQLEAIVPEAQAGAEKAAADLEEATGKLAELSERRKQRAMEAEAAGAEAAAGMEASEEVAEIVAESAAAMAKEEQDPEAAEEAKLREELVTMEDAVKQAKAKHEDLDAQLQRSRDVLLQLQKLEGQEESLISRSREVTASLEASVASFLASKRRPREEAASPEEAEAAEAAEGASAEGGASPAPAAETPEAATSPAPGSTPGVPEEETVQPAVAESPTEPLQPFASFAAIGLESSFEDTGPDFPKLRATLDDMVPPPCIPKEPPIPPPSFAQVVQRPHLRLPRAAVERFSLLTPAEEGGAEEPRSDSKGAAAEDVMQPTRWLIEPHGKVRLLLKFFSEDIGTYQAALCFEVVGGINNNAPVSIAASGITAFPGISSDPRNVFTRRAKMKPASGYASKQFILSTGVFEFGPLLIGRSADSRADAASDPHVKQHVENFRITNNSLFKADVAFALASAQAPPAEDPGKKTPGGKKGEPAPTAFEEYPFLVEPSELELEVGETKELKVSCFPVKEGTYTDTIIAKITDNPDPVEFAIAAIGSLPKVTLDTTELDFDRILVKQRMSNGIKVANVSAVPVKWRLEAANAVPEAFEIEPMEGILAVAEEKHVVVVFRSDTACSHKFGLSLQISDTEGLRKFENAAEIQVMAEAFVVDVVPEFPNNGVGLDFGDVRVGATMEQTFNVANNGKYPVNFDIKIRRRAIQDIMKIDYGTPPEEGKFPELQPGQKQAIKVSVVAPVAMQCPEPKRFARTGKNEELELLVYEAKTGERVQLETPLIPLTLRAVHNSFNLAPPRGLSFGPVKIGESNTREFEIYNDGPFKFDWFIFDATNMKIGTEDMKKPEKGELLVGDFKIVPAEGSLAPQDKVKIVGTFTATEPKFCEHKIGIHVDGLPDDSRSGGGSRDDAFAGDAGDKGFREYILTAQSCTPGIDTENMQSMFEEQFVAPTLEDAIATAGRVDIRAFDEEARYFSFGPVSLQGPSDRQEPAKFRITNPNPIPCDVKFDIKPTIAPTGKEVPVLPFELSNQELHIPPHEYRYVKVRFTPQGLQRYSAIFEATVPEGKDSKTNHLKFEMRGDGTVPSISMTGPTLFGDDGGQYDFGKLRLGKTQVVEFTLANQGVIPATARCDLTPNPHFTVSCARSIPLEPKATQKFQVAFCPTESGSHSTFLKLHTLHNSFEDMKLTFVGQGYVEDVSWELPPGDSSPEGTGQDDSDVLRMGETCVGSEKVVNFQLNNSGKNVLRFQFPETLPAPLSDCLQITPSVGHILPGMKKSISFTYRPTESMQADVPLPVQVAGITQDGDVQDWDDTRMEDVEGEEPAPVSEPAHAVAEGTAREMPLRILAAADQMAFECGTERIHFSPTVLFQTRLHRFTVANPSKIALPYNWRILPASGADVSAGSQAYAITPVRGTIAAGSTQEFQIRFAPKEVHDFAGILESRMPIEDPLRIRLQASALRPWCHFEVPISDYRSRRQAETPLDPKYQVIEFESLGTRVRNTKRFYVLNPTSDTYEFHWMPEESDKRETEDPFRCLTKRGTILPGKKYEMLFEYLPADTEIHESRWLFSVPGKQASQAFVLVGTVKEPRMGLDRPCIKFNRLLLGGKAIEKVCIVNKEHLPFSFAFDHKSYEADGPAAISLSPDSGVVGPGASFPIEVKFSPNEERFFNYNVVCNIKRKEKPLLLNIKGEGYKIHTKLVLEEADREGRVLHPGVKELLDFGDMQVQERQSFTLKLSSPTFERDHAAAAEAADEQVAVSYDFIWQLRSATGRLMTPQAEVPPYLTITPVHGVATQDGETVITIEYSPTDAHKLDGASLRMLIPSGPDDASYTLGLAGRAYRPMLDFSTQSHDFGPCFVKRTAASAGEPSQGKTPLERLDLTVTNRGMTDCWLSTTFQRTSYLDVQLPASMVEAGSSLVVPIIFTPKDYVDYRECIEFVVNDCTKYYVNLRGQGCPLQLEAASLAMQNVDFGVAVGNTGVSRSLRVVNRSVRPVEFALQDADGKLAEKCVSWSPTMPVKLRPKEQTSFELRYKPSFPMPVFKLPLVASCNFGIDMQICHVTGSCHAAEVRLSEHSLLFGDVVFGATSTKRVHLHNFGDLGVKFRFDVPTKLLNIFSVEPSEGYAAPRDDVSLQVKFHPQRSGGSDSQPKRLRCLLDPPYQQEPIELIVQGNGMEQPEDSALQLQFSAEVVTFPPSGKNTSSEPWKVRPVINTEIPAGETFFSCPGEITVPAGGQATIPITYRPLTMTRTATEADEDTSPAKGKKKDPVPPKHLGRLFASTPDGSAFVWTLEGVSNPPGQDKKLTAEVQCKTPHVQSIPLTNWLQQNQRFHVAINLVHPAEATEEIKLNGIGTFDARQAKDYKFNVYAYREGAAVARIVFTNPKTDEFVGYEISFKFVAPKSIDTLRFNTVCRQVATRSISVMNPLSSVAKFKCQATHQDFRFSQNEFSVAPNSEATVDVLFRPVIVGSGEAKLSLSSPELGDFPYTVEYVAKAAGLDKTIVFKAPLGSMDSIQPFRFWHYAQKATTFSATIEAAPGQKSVSSDFAPEIKDSAPEVPVPVPISRALPFFQEVKVDAAGAEGQEASINVRFTPSELGEIRGLLVLTSPDGGEYKALLMGYAQPPQPQGPVDVPKGKPTNVEFQNPFAEPVEFSLQVDNPSFQLTQRAVKLDSKKTAFASVPIPVSFTGDKAQGGRLLVSAGDLPPGRAVAPGYDSQFAEAMSRKVAAQLCSCPESYEAIKVALPEWASCLATTFPSR